MALTAAQIVVLRRPSLAGDSRLTSMLELAEMELSEDLFEDLYAKAVALLALHYYAKDERGPGGAAGAITSESEGQLSRSYASPVGAGGVTAHDWESTTWGQELLALTRTVTMGACNSVQED